MSASHYPVLVAVSIGLGILASYVALDLSGRIDAARGWTRDAWTAGAAVALGIGIWTVHFIGMLALRLQSGTGNVPIAYHVGRMLPALLAAAGGSALAVVAACRTTAGVRSLAVAGLSLAAAMVGAHYVAIASMRVPAYLAYDWPVVAASVALAVVASYGALLLAVRLRSGGARPRAGRRLVIAIALGGAIAGVHYTAMAAVRWTPTGESIRIRASDVLATGGLAAAIVAATLVLLGLALLSAILDSRLALQADAAEQYARLYREADAARAEAEAARQRTQESEERFRSLAVATAQAVWTTDARGQIDDAPMWRALTGQSREEVRGLGWLDAIHPDDRARVMRAWRLAVEERSMYEAEYRLRLAGGSYRWVLTRGVPVTESDGTVREWVGTCTDIHERKRAQHGQELLLDAARALESSLELDHTLAHVTGLLVPRVADYCLVYLRDEDGSYRQVAAAHADPAKAPLLDELGRIYQPDLHNPHSMLARALTTREPALVRSVTPELLRSATPKPEARRIVEALGPLTYMVLPLIARGELLGTLSLVTSASGRRYDREDVANAELIAARAALAIANARLYHEARQAGERTVRAAQLERQLVEARLEALRAQLNPHFLFNALNTVAMLVRRQANADALRAVVSLSELLRRILAERGAAEVPLREELALVGRYLDIEQLRFRDRLRVRTMVEPEALGALVPPLALQPLVENAIKHGVARREQGGTIEIAGWRKEHTLVLEVRDDGPGFPPDWDPSVASGVGLANTRKRLESLYDGACRFEVGSAPQGGALVSIELPFRSASDG